MTEANRLISEAMALLRDADRVAVQIRADADGYRRRRVSEADLLVQKARRVLVAAEAKAEVIVAAARAARAGDDVEGDEVDQVIDLDALAAGGDEPAAVPQRADQPESALDKLLETAIERAVDRAFPMGAARS